MSRESRRREDESYREWKGAYRPYDILREASIALGVVLALAVVLTILFSSPDLKPSTIQSWSRGDPVDFVTTATTELDGTSGTGGYGPPYNHASDGQHIAFVYLGEVARREPPDQHRTGLRARAAALDHRAARAADRGLHLRGRAGEDPDGLDERLRDGAWQRNGQPGRLDHGQARQLRAAADDDGLAAHLRPERRARRRAADQQAVLPDRLHQAAAVHGRRRRARQTAPSSSTCSAPSGE